MRWPRAKLSDVAMIVMGQSPPGETYNTDGIGLPFFQGKADFGTHHPTPRKWCYAPTRIAKAGDILLSIRAPVGPTNVVRETSCIGRGLAAIRTNPEFASRRYVLFFLKYSESQLSSRAYGSTFSAINQSDVSHLEVPLAPLHEQHRIVEILDQADRIRSLRSTADAKYKRVVQALFSKMFGKLHSDWAVTRLGSVLRPKKGALQSGPFGSHLHNHDFGPSGTVLAVGIDNVLDGKFVLGRNRRITREKYGELRKYTLERGDVLITIMGTVGRTCVFPGEPSPAICTKHVYRIQPDKTVNPDYLAATLRFSQHVRAQLGASVTGQIVSGINSGNLKRLEIRVPPLGLQSEFARRKHEFDDIHQRASKVGETCNALFDSLMHLAFTGNLTVSQRDVRMEELLQEVEHQKAVEIDDAEGDQD